jgi:hypothetical protein
MMIVVACRQIVGIHDDPATEIATEACGLPHGPGCAACVQDRCCAESRACAGKPECASYATCLTDCAGDAACRARCSLDHSLSSEPESSSLRACLVASCGSACGVSCGALADLTAPPESAVACEKCIDNGLCAEDALLASDPHFSLYFRCSRACRTPDCQLACEPYAFGDAAPPQIAPDGGSDAAAAPSGGDCRRACASGEDWTCAGHLPWPAATTDASVLTTTLFGDEPAAFAGVRLTACTALDCSPPRPTTVVDEAGVASFTVPLLPGQQGPGLAEYLHLTVPNDDGGDGTFIPLASYWGFPLSQARHRYGSLALHRSTVKNILASVHEDPNRTDRGHITLFIYDCQSQPARHVRVASSSGKVFYYVNGNAPAEGATETSDVGLASIANVEPGFVHLTVTPTSRNAPTHDYSVVVRAGELTMVNMFPTP